MPYPRLTPLMLEYGLELDDVRWYLSVEMADELLSYQQEPIRLIELIWSGKIGDRLFNLEEHFLDSLEERWNSGLTDESRVRELCSAIRVAKRRRKGSAYSKNP